jgi:hypothetical protein
MVDPLQLPILSWTLPIVCIFNVHDVSEVSLRTVFRYKISGLIPTIVSKLEIIQFSRAQQDLIIGHRVWRQ